MYGPSLARLLAAALSVFCAVGAARAAIDIRTPPDAPPLQRLAAKEVARYLYLRTGSLPGQLVQDGAVVIAQRGAPAVDDAAVRRAAADLQPQHYLLKTTTARGKQTWWIVGGDDQGALYGAYRFAEKLGVRFYLHGDVIPDERLAELPAVNEAGKPLFALRGLNPWGSHPFGFDAWSTDDYKAIFSQLAKMRMNFLGLHCYPEGHPYAEPTVWHGTRGDFDGQGRVSFSYPAHYYNAIVKGHWGPILPKATSQFSLGGGLLFEDDAWAPEVMRGHCPEPDTPAACNAVFNRMGAQFHEAFGFARALGVKTCLGTETPLVLPRALRERLRGLDQDPDAPATVRGLYEATFRRIAASHPLDYYWLWTPESWTHRGNDPAQYSATVADLRLAVEALRASAAPLKLATCGWVLGPQHDRAALDNDLPEDIPLSAISRHLGWTAVDPAYGRIAGREKWAIPWLESDGRHGLAALQLFVGRMRRDAADALAYGCTGLMGLHWRTDILAPNVSALAQAAWDQGGWNPAPGKLPAGDAVSEEGPLGGRPARYPGQKIANTADAPLYQACRFDLAGYDLKLPNGRYRVTLKFCEPHFNAAGRRVGDYQLQGQTVIENLDIFARAGKFAALDLAFENVEVTDGWLRLRVQAKTSMPLISAIVAEGPATRKINCGGPAYQDFEADDQAAAVDVTRYLPCDDFYADWARANFGSPASDEIARVFAAVDGRLPESVGKGCPSGSLAADPQPWSEVANQYACVAQLAQLRSRVRGVGNLARFDWWLDTFRYHRALHQVRCTLGEFDLLVKENKTAAALAMYKELLAIYGEAYQLLLATVNSPAGLATVVNLENHAEFWPRIVEGPAQKLEAATGRPLPDDAKPARAYPGQPRIIVPTVRTVVCQHEALTVKFIVLDARPPASVTVAWRPLGDGEFRKLPVQHVARAVYRFVLPPTGGSVEYRIEAVTAGGASLVWPATAPTINQTLVAW